MGNYTVAGLRNYYLNKWNNMQITRPAAVNAAANKVISGRARYIDLEKVTGVPWKVIGIIHLRESDCNFHTHLHNGDSLNARTRHVPAGRPVRGQPPFTFEYSAIDALTYEGFTKIKDWSIEQIAYCFEQYNGWGYRMNGYPSAYLWSGTNQYTSGKYIADGVFSPTTVDIQLGTMAVLKRICEVTGEMPASTIPVPANNNLPLPTAVPITSPVNVKAIPPKLSNKDMNTLSRKHFLTDMVGLGVKGVAGVVALIKALDLAAIQATQQYITALKSFMAEDGIYIALLALITFGLYTTVMKDWMKQDIQEGRASPSGAVAIAPTVLPTTEVPEASHTPASGPAAEASNLTAEPAAVAAG